MKRLLGILICTIYCMAASAWTVNYGVTSFDTTTINLGKDIMQMHPDYAPKATSRLQNITFATYAALCPSQYKMAAMSNNDGMPLMLANDLTPVEGSAFAGSGVALLFTDRYDYYCYSCGVAWHDYVHTVELTYFVLDNNENIQISSPQGGAIIEKVNTDRGVNIYKAIIRLYSPVKSFSININSTSDTGNSPFKKANNLKLAIGAVLTDMTIISAKPKEYALMYAEQSMMQECKQLRGINQTYQSLIQRYAKSASADLNEDGLVNGADVVAVYNQITNGTPQLDGHEYVDLGLPSGTCWATANLGALLPESYGDYYAYCEESSFSYYTNKSYYSRDNYHRLTQVEPPLGGTLSSSIVYFKWGPRWRLPSLADWEELTNPLYTKQELAELNGVKGLSITSLSNGNKIFLPQAGSVNTNGLIEQGEYGSYWTSSNSPVTQYAAQGYSINPQGETYWVSAPAHTGRSVRAVCTPR